MNRPDQNPPRIETNRFRRGVAYAACLAAVGVLLWRAVDLQWNEGGFLQDQGAARHERVVVLPTHRGRILDRHGVPLAISAPMASVWAIPGVLRDQKAQFPELAKRLGVSRGFIEKRAAADGGFVYLRRQMIPEDADRVLALGLNGVKTQREYRRYYPAAESAAQVLGFTNIDDAGQEGLELAFESWLTGEPGQRRVIKDRLGRVIGDLGIEREPRPGRDLRLSLDRRIQYLAYRELKAAVRKHRAKGGMAVIADPNSGELLAVVNQPSFNPNHRLRSRTDAFRNRVFTDLFEPGSTLKPLTVLAALGSGDFRPDSEIDTTSGVHAVSGHPIKDLRDYGRIDVTGVITHSSNVGAAKLALAVGREPFAQTLRRAGLGHGTRSGFPGERVGVLRNWRDWRPIEHATQAFGYGLSVTAAQLVRAYAMLAADGVVRPLTLLRADAPVAGERRFPAADARRVRAMMETVVGPEGTGRAARIPGYTAAGKTGTVYKHVDGGYAEDRYLALFAGIAPARNPRLVMVVLIDEPNAGEHVGGRVAAPVFARVMAGALRLLNAPPTPPQTPKPFRPPVMTHAPTAETRT